MTTRRFDLENYILAMWSTKEDIDLLAKQYMDGVKPFTEDEMANALIGISTIHDMRSQRVFDLFEDMIKNKEIV